MEVSKQAIICAAQHMIAAHESACTGKPVEWGSVCESCRESNHCRLDWIERLAPLFDAAGIYPNICGS